MNEPTPDDLARDLAADYEEITSRAWLARCNYPATVAGAALRRALAAEAILNAPQVALFADGREPTTNERHLLNLLSWREKEAKEAKAEVQRLQAIIEGLSDRVAAQSELLSRRAEG